jgi:cation diffusion facilitator CzcD-associated flavoprotein CzcO
MRTNTENGTQHFDVLIIGAGISGIDAAYHLQHQRPESSFLILEALESFGGTWLTHTYPGIRSDSDLYTFGFEFKAWRGAPIASAAEILNYMGEVIEENQLHEHIRYQHQITDADWSSEDARWTLRGQRTDTGEAVVFTTSFLWMCQGYYRHSSGYTPEWPGMENFVGPVIHPQRWPADLDLAGKKVAVIGSGATAATLVPAIAGSCAHVTMVQRSPTYFYPSPNSNEVADMLRELDIPDEWVHEIVRKKILLDQKNLTALSFSEPELVRGELLRMVTELLPEDYDVATHFTPRYMPWRQRLAKVPDGDLFRGIRDGQASVVTGDIQSFTSAGLTMTSGEQVAADIIVTATGFDLSVLGDITFRVDEVLVDFAETVTYRGMMFTGVPNLAWVFGYFRASWTLRADLVSNFLCRLFTHMDELGVRSVTPQLRSCDEDMELSDWVKGDDFNPGYLRRSMHLMPKCGDVAEWRHSQDYWEERELFPSANLDDGCLIFTPTN